MERIIKNNVVLLSIIIFRETVPSSKDVRLIRKIGLETAKKLWIYILFFDT